MNFHRPLRPWRTARRALALGQRTCVMAILNLTPDSFYAPSRLGANFVEAARAALDQGADILDLGAESTRPGATPLSPADEAARLLPALVTVRRAFPDALLSVDTRHTSTAAAALDSGADIINDVTALEDPAMAPLLARAGCGAILMHHRGDFATMHRLPDLADPLATVHAGLAAIRDRALAAGIAPDQIALDPGFGFGKNLDQNFPVLAGLDLLHALGAPLVAGLSRKSFLGPGAPEQRLPATLAASTAALLAGAHILRVHDVAATRAAAAVADRLLASSHP
ncbi:MAG TPA: dihydropteroate synthase [Terriglobales bacterium]|nr:dihydropteroate synthase [Terriglobales bacterium]